MFSLIGRLFKMQAMTGITLPELIVIVQRIASLGSPPPVEKEVELRQWIRDLVEIGEQVATETPTLVDDYAVKVASGLLATDSVWAISYSAIVRIFSEDDVLDGLRQAEIEVEMTRALAETEEDNKLWGVNPIAIVMTLRAIVQIIHMWRSQQ